MITTYGFMIRPFHGISKIMATPAWTAICTGISMAVFLILYLIADQGKFTRWAVFIMPAGFAALTCYLVPDLLYSWLWPLEQLMPSALLGGIAGLIKSLLFSLLVVWITGHLVKRGIQLKVYERHVTGDNPHSICLLAFAFFHLLRTIIFPNMKKYSLINTITGWVVFVIAAFVYLSTIEPTASFWDCGEFISSAFKLEVGHPPGAPLFMMVGRFFTLFAGKDVTMVPKMVNSMSALFSALTILFLFWSITHLARKIVAKDGEMNTAQMIAIISSGLVGSLAYTFSDTFWFSAVEGEVYASSSLFTALVFWAILKWENAADEPGANRWIIFIAYLMGLSIGVHLLNLLAIPAIVLVYYFRKHEISALGMIKALAISLIILGGVMYLLIPGTVKIASIFELIFVNSFGLPFNSGILFYAILLLGLIIFGIYYTHKHGKVILNTILLAGTVILIGYSSYAMLVVRSAADTPMDQNDPEDLFSLLYYLNREQYGDRPLFTGQYFNAPILRSKPGKPSYYKEDNRYKENNYRINYVYDSKYTTLFPRMWSNDEAGGHIDAYIRWANLKEKDLYQPRTDQNGNAMTGQDGQVVYDHNKPRKSPNFSQNLVFFWRYQVVQMYFRYFMWNFSGRQNDIQANYKSEINKGNWISGIPFIDTMRLGNQNKLPDSMRNNKANNRYFMLPLLLGLVGLYYQYKKHRKDYWAVMVFFLMTGLAIVVYLNQSPMQPRERDYAYAGSFYAFSIWIGLGVLALYDLLKKYVPDSSGAVVAGLIALVAVPSVMGMENWDDHDRSGRYVARDIAYNYLNSCEKNAVLFTNGDNDTFPLWYAQEVEGIRTDVRVMNLSYLGADWYIRQMQRKAYDSDPVPFSLTPDQYRTGSRDIVYVIDRIREYTDLKKVIDFVASDDPRTKQLPEYTTEKIDYLPTRLFSVPVDTSRVLHNGTVLPADAAKLTPEMKWELEPSRSYITKNHLMILDLMATNNWERPVYYAMTVSDDNYLNLDKYFRMEGLAYRVTPIASEGDMFGKGGINSSVMYDKMVNTFKWGGVNTPGVYLDENVQRMLANFRSTFARLALQLINEGKPDSARTVLEKCNEVIPDRVVPYNVYNILIVEAYFKLGDTQKALEMANTLKKNVFQDIDYFLSLGRKYNSYLTYEKRVAYYSLDELRRMGETYNQPDLKKEVEEKQQAFANSLSTSM